MAWKKVEKSLLGFDIMLIKESILDASNKTENEELYNGEWVLSFPH